MKNNLRFILLVSFASTSLCLAQKTKIPTWNASKISVDERGLITYQLNLEAEKKDTIEVDFTYWGEWIDSKIFAGKDTFKITKKTPKQSFIICKTEGKKKVIIDINTQHPPFNYDNHYKKENFSKVTIEVPEVHELANIIIALSDQGKKAITFNDVQQQYFHRVQAFFSIYRNHPLISYLNKKADEGLFTNFKENAAAYVLKDGKIIPSQNYNGFRARDEFKKSLPLVEDFARKSRFQDFYKKETEFYDALIRTEIELAEIETMWRWLEAKFDGKFQSYKVFMSPLNTGSHSTRTFGDGLFKEAIMFISAPDLDQKEETLIKRRFFTEIDHNYVNPVSWQYKEEINLLLHDHLKKWNIKEDYASPLLTFNEYMTWGVFGLYLYDKQGEAIAKSSFGKQINFVQDKRGFVKFGDFFEELLNLYKRQEEKKINPLYPLIIEWMKKENEKR